MAHEKPDEALTALVGLLNVFRQGRIVDPTAERDGVERCTKALSSQWVRRFPGFPSDDFPFASLRGELRRGRRDAHLKDIIVRLLTQANTNGMTVVNAACVFGRHARDLAARIRPLAVIGTDIDPNWFRIYHTARLGRFPGNFKFVKDDIFDSRLDVKPTAVVFFGACGSVSDGAIDYAIRSRAAYVMCRTCCHDNIGGNTEIAKRATVVNRFFRFKNWTYRRIRRKPRYAGFFFSDRFAREAYPRSGAARGISTPDEFQAVARHSVESDICRAIIDLDRYLYLIQNGYDVWYRGELFVAERRGATANVASAVVASYDGR